MTPVNYFTSKKENFYNLEFIGKVWVLDPNILQSVNAKNTVKLMAKNKII